MRAIGKLGEIVWVQWDELRHATAVIGTVLCLSVQPRYWARPLWNFFARQVLAVGVEPLGFVCGVAASVGARRGETAQPGVPLVTVVSLSGLRVEALVPARQLSSLKVGQSAKVAPRDAASNPSMPQKN